MYKVKFSVKESFFAEYGAEQEKTVSKEELADASGRVLLQVGDI